MDFFESQDRAKRQTGLLLFLYLLAVAAIIVAVYAVTVVASIIAGMDLRLGEPMQETGWLQYWDWPLFGWVAGITLLIITGGSLYRILELRGDGGRVARLLGGTPVSPSTDDPAARRLVNVVEEMSIASGTPVPEIYILEMEQGINAFAAGDAPGNAAVAVTRAALETLSRDELQGVIAHEFSHILNGDMALNVRLMGILNGILLIHVIGLSLLRGLFWSGGSHRRSSWGGFSGGGGSRGRGGGGGGAAIIAIIAASVALTVIGYLGVVFARLIQSAISRRREYLADAAAVQFTRNPSGIAGALKKIGGLVHKGQVRSSHTVEAGHFFFVNALSRTAANLFATHPPLRRRIRKIDPSFDGKFPVVKAPRFQADTGPKPPEAVRRRQPAGGTSPLPGGDFLPIRPEILLATIGTMGEAHRERAAGILDGFPDELRDAAHDTLGAKAIVYLLLASGEETTRARQMELLKEKADPRVLGELEKLAPAVSQLKPEARLPLLDIAFPALRQLSPEQYGHFREVVKALIAADDRVSLFEYCLEKILFQHLEEHISGKKRGIAQLHSFKALTDEIAVVLSILAHAGKKDTAKAFGSGVSQLSMIQGDIRLLPVEACSADAIDRALERLAQMTPPMKKRFLQAASFCVASDNRLAVEEGELLRAVADSLGCPMPPILGGRG